MTYPAVSLFSGAGIFDYGVSRAGFDILAQVEIEPFCRKVLEKHKPQYWPNSTILEDVRNAGRHNLPANPAFCYGGFPCTDLSIAGKRAGIAPETRSGLWFEFARIIGDIRPRYVLLENVPAIAAPRKLPDGTYHQSDGLLVIAGLTALGYDCTWGVISAADAGAPHLRERWWCVAHSVSGRSYCPDAWSCDHRSQREQTSAHRSEQSRSRTFAEVSRADVAHPDSERQPQRQGDVSQFGGRAEYGSEEQRGVGQADAYGQSARYGYDGTSGVFQDGLSKDEGRGATLPDQNVGNAFACVGRAAIRTAAGMDERLWPARPGKAQRPWERPRTTKEKVPDRASRLKALGNSGIWQIVYALATEIRAQLEAEDNAAATGGR